MISGITSDILEATLKSSLKEEISFDNKILQLFSTLPTRPECMGIEIWKNYLLYYPGSALIINMLFKDIFGLAFESDKFLDILITKANKAIGREYTNFIFIRTFLNRNFSNPNSFFSFESKDLHRTHDIRFKQNRNKLCQEVCNSKHLTSLNLIEGTLVHGHFDFKTNPINSFIHSYYFDKLNINYVNFTKKLETFNNRLITTIKQIFTPKTDNQSSILILNRDSLNVLPYENLYNNNLSTNLNISSPYNTYSLNETFREFEYLINSDAEERYFQTFFKNNPIFLLSLGNYKNLHSHLILRSNTEDFIPDFFLETADDNFVDICELKRPSDKIVYEMNKYTKFRDKIAVAKAQINAYREFFDDEKNRVYFEEKYGLKGYKPDVVLVIGNDENYSGMVKRKLLNADLPSYLKLKTYNEILQNAKRILSYRNDFFKNINGI